MMQEDLVLLYCNVTQDANLATKNPGFRLYSWKDWEQYTTLLLKIAVYHYDLSLDLYWMISKHVKCVYW